MTNPVNDLREVLEENTGIRKRFEPVPKLSKEAVDYGIADFISVKCEICTFFIKPSLCTIVEGDIEESWVCDAYQDGDCPSPKYGGYGTYEIAHENWEAFVKSMVEKQPLRLTIRGGFDTPAGQILMMEDSMSPKTHKFSIYKYDFVEYTSMFNGWTQSEVDGTMIEGRSEETE